MTDIDITGLATGPDRNYLDELNPQQRAAVEYCDGPELVIAGAGSGKTRVLTYKIMHLLYNGYEPWRILALTFTNKAAREMRQRIEGLMGSTCASKLWMGTFHSIFARLLRSNADRIGFRSSFTIYDTSDSKSLVKMIIRDFDLDEKIYKPSIVLSAISGAKNALVSPDEYASNRELMEYDRKSRRPRLYELYRAYQQRCFTAGVMDFDDLLYYTYLLLRDNPDLRRHYSEFFRFVLVDEYQDTNLAQHTIVQMLTEEAGNVCVVGDDAQSIYSFRGASMANILNLQNAYPTLATFKLEQNYRSTQNIISTANSLIDKNKVQIRKNIFSLNAPGDKVEVMHTYSDMEEATMVAARISRQHMVTGDSYEDFAILYRTNAQSRQLEEALRKRNIDYRIWGGLSFYQRKEVKDAVAYFRLAVNPDDDEALLRVINTPSRKIGDTTMKKISRCALDSHMSLWGVISDTSGRFAGLLSKATWTRVGAFADLIRRFNRLNNEGKHNANEFATLIINESGLLAELVSERTPESISRRENLQELINGTREFVDMRLEAGEEGVGLSDFLTLASLATDQDQTSGADREAVTLMTVHASKGLEFGNVFIVGVEDELFPSSMSQGNPAAFEEERRLLYVAITRAKRFCMMTYAGSRFRNGQTVQTRPSPFLADIDPAFIKVSDSSDIGRSSSNNPMDRYRMSYHTPTAPMAPRRAASPAPPVRAVAKPAEAQSAPAADAGDFHTVNASDLRPGMRIHHKQFGPGKVISIDTSQPNHRITANFDLDQTERLILLKYAKIIILG